MNNDVENSLKFTWKIFIENVFFFRLICSDVVSLSGELQACCKFDESVKMALNVQSSWFFRFFDMRHENSFHAVQCTCVFIIRVSSEMIITFYF